MLDFTTYSLSLTIHSGATAQVTPLELTTKLMESARSKGAQVLLETVDSLMIEGDSVTGVRLKGRETLPADIVIITMGPWSAPFVEDNFRIPLPMEGIKSTSLVYTDLDEIRTEPFACFCAEDRNGCHLELYPRSNGDLYICGCGGSDYVKADRLREGGDCDAAEKILADPARVEAAATSFRDMSSIASRYMPSVQQVFLLHASPAHTLLFR
jgi:glycine/D-amino acid oxidase-like deaminating enzyme